jgi:hypothetical protein
MLRVGLAAVVAAFVGISLTGCSSLLSSNSSSEQVQALNFESDPPGAEIRTTQGQTCVTPCELTVPSHEQPVTITKNEYVPQTVQVTMRSQPDHSFWQNPPSTLNPVRRFTTPVAIDRFPKHTLPRQHTLPKQRTLPRQCRRRAQLPAPSHRRRSQPHHRSRPRHCCASSRTRSLSRLS